MNLCKSRSMDEGKKNNLCANKVKLHTRVHFWSGLILQGLCPFKELKQRQLFAERGLGKYSTKISLHCQNENHVMGWKYSDTTGLTLGSRWVNNFHILASLSMKFTMCVQKLHIAFPWAEMFSANFYSSMTWQRHLIYQKPEKPQGRISYQS